MSEMDLKFGKIKNIVSLHEVNFKTYALIWIWRSKPKTDGAPGPTCDFIVGLFVPVVTFRIFDNK